MHKIALSESLRIFYSWWKHRQFESKDVLSKIQLHEQIEYWMIKNQTI